MIWNSIPLMTAIDLLIIAVTIYAIWPCRLIGPSKRPSAPQTGLRLIVLGLVGICLFYFVDLLSMYVSPAVMSRQEAMAFMDTLHQNVSWFAVLFAMVAISSGFIELRCTQIELAEKNELLADLSSKLAKFLPAQLYNSIFAGGHSARVAAKRKKLTIFFSDIANFTETTDSLESEELTNLLNQYLTEMSKVAISHGATIDKYVGDAIMAFFGDPTSRGSIGLDRVCQDGDRYAAAVARAAAQLVGSRVGKAIPATRRDQHGFLHRRQFRQRGPNGLHHRWQRGEPGREVAVPC
jgi:hypothetical protein